MSRNIVKSQESKNGQYRIQVMYDECPMCPCTEWDMVGCFLFEYSRSSILHDDSNWREVYNAKWDNNRHSLEDAVRTLVYHNIDEKDIKNFLKKGTEKFKLSYTRKDKMWEIYENYRGEWDSVDWYDCTFDELDAYALLEHLDIETMVAIIQKCGEDIVAKEFSLTGYSQGDYVSGVAFTTKERFVKLGSSDTTDWKKKAYDMIDEDKDCVNRWMWGDVYGYVLEEKRKFTKTYEDGEITEDYEWNEVDSCWGFFCDPDEVISENLPEK